MMTGRRPVKLVHLVLSWPWHINSLECKNKPWPQYQMVDIL